MSAVLRHVLLLQRDVPAAARFYQEGLGLVVTVCTERWAELSDGTGRAGGGAAAGAGDAGASPGRTIIALKAVEGEAQRTAGYSPLLSFTVTDMDVTINNLLRLGAVLDGGACRLTWRPVLQWTSDCLLISSGPVCPHAHTRRILLKLSHLSKYLEDALSTEDLHLRCFL